MQYELGKVISIDNLLIKVEILDKYISSYYVLNGEAIRIGGVSNIVICSYFVYQIISEQINETKDNTSFDRKIFPREN